MLTRIDFILKKIEGFNVSGICIHLGSAEGNLHSKLKKIPKLKCVGVDIVKNKNVDVVFNLNNSPFPFKNKYADCIVATGPIIDHMNDPFNFLKESNRILKTGGKMLLEFFNAQGINYILGKYEGVMYCWNEQTMTEMVKRTGFKILKTNYESFFWKRNILLRLLSFIAVKFRTRIFFSLEKERCL